MKLINQTRQITLAEEVITPKSFRDQSMGLLAYETPIAMLLKSRWGIHTLFMKYPIDVLILDKHNQVVAIKEHMQPNDIFLWNPRYDTIVELPEKTIIKSKTQLGDIITV